MGGNSQSGQNIFIPHQVNNFPLDLRNAGMSLGPIRELSAGPKPGGVSTFTTRLREVAKEVKREMGGREGGRWNRQ